GLGTGSSLHWPEWRESLVDKWEARKALIVSRAGTRIDFGAYYDPKRERLVSTFITLKELLEVTNDFVYSLLYDNPSKKLSSINLAACAITDECIAVIAATCPALESLNVSGCRSVTDGSVKYIAKYTKLVSLYAWSCTQLTDESIKAIATNCSALQSLDVRGCKLTDASI
ncbi:MAG: hypothetical protein AAFV01_17975, partial [Bacteroidota bacterium]